MEDEKENKQKDSFKMSLARVFDDDLRTEQWQNVLDYVIIGLIFVSTVEVFLSTYKNITENYGKILNFIDVFTTIFFTVEVTLRIWAADAAKVEYKGFRGRLRYCFTFYGIIDILSTYPFWLGFIMPVPYTAFKILRTLRLIRVFRYMKSFRLLGKAISSKKRELSISMAFLCILTVILSFLLFFAEHMAQPDKFENGWKTIVWAFAKYLGDPGKISDFELVTPWGHFIAAIIGILGIAIFAVPAGLIGSGFTDAMDEERKMEQNAENVKKLHLAFERKMCRYTRYQIVPPFVSIADIQARMRMSVDDILDAIDASDEFRLINLASTQTVEQHPEDRLAVEHYHKNKSYGCFIDRGSKVTIISPANVVDAVMGNFAYYVAKIGGFNYISRETGATQPYQSFFLISEPYETENLREFLDDLNSVAKDEDSWTICLLAASGANEPSYPSQFHFAYGGKKGDETYNGEKLTIHDIQKFDTWFKDISRVLEEQYGLKSDCQRYHNSSSAKVLPRHLAHADKVNSVMLRIAWSVTCWDMRRIQIAKTLAESIANHLEMGESKTISKELTRKDIGYVDYRE